MKQSPRESRIWAVVPAAGIGRRMGEDRPKQYLPLAGRTVIEWALDRLLGLPGLSGAVLAISGDDPFWPELAYRAPVPLETVAGGEQRATSVLNALDRLAERADPGDWVLVHDAARPCLRPSDVETLCRTVGQGGAGGLLAVPVRDTVKRDDGAGHVAETVDRRGLWRALTPQMFPLGPLRDALRAALAGAAVVTDEASAMEAAGHRPRLVEGAADNIKITHPADLGLAELYLRGQGEEA